MRSYRATASFARIARRSVAGEEVCRSDIAQPFENPPRRGNGTSGEILAELTRDLGRLREVATLEVLAVRDGHVGGRDAERSGLERPEQLARDSRDDLAAPAAGLRRFFDHHEATSLGDR